MRARRFDVIREPGAIAQDKENVFVPLEVICRHYLAGSGWRRYQRGEVSAEELRFAPGTNVKEGVKLPKPYLEVSTKFEKFDRLLDRAEALEISNLTDDEFDAIQGILGGRPGASKKRLQSQLDPGRTIHCDLQAANAAPNCRCDTKWQMRLLFANAVAVCH